ncbi:hypothetical protein V2A60_007689 [Cordyceps javanica]|uniref:DUF1479 domain-containing protein n=1 Tax=Cordyceps javanica TaxID=43265 RepID=A0A545W738_9HYPO|nr:DUF1479 domain-containing protein [Cordyceps javanica]TQW09803.1 hypothetical protein IF2G_02593 [Cordyceps javanica]
MASTKEPSTDVPSPDEPSQVPAPDEITHDEFASLLNDYPSLVEKISQSKGSKPGQKSLQQLDEFRYGKAIAEFGGTASSSSKEMTLDDVRLLVEWKLRHGKFRPMLMGLASSNNAAVTRRTIAAAIQAYRASSPSSSASPTQPGGGDGDGGGDGVTAALAALTKLRGIGPATASLLLSVHDPARVIFFSDEAFYWLCAGGVAGRKIKYSNSEYEMLRRNAAKLVGRLGVSATDVEKVAYVLFKRDTAPQESSKAARKPAKAAKVAKAAKAAKTAKVTENTAKDTKGVKEQQAKRKSAAAEEPEPAQGTRRSKRVKK